MMTTTTPASIGNDVPVRFLTEWLNTKGINDCILYHTMIAGDVPKLPKMFDFSGVYFILDADTGSLLYVGESVSVYKRVKTHVKLTVGDEFPFIFKGYRLVTPMIVAIQLFSFQQMLQIEADAIAELNPKYNIAQHSLHLKRKEVAL